MTVAQAAPATPRSLWSWFHYFAVRPAVLLASLCAALVGVLTSLNWWLPDGVAQGEVVGAAVASGNNYIAMVGLGLGSWMGVRSRARGIVSLERGAVGHGTLAPAVRVGAAAFAIALASLVSSAVNGIVMLARPWRDGFIDPRLILYGLASAAAMVPLGYLLARLLPHYLAIPGIVIGAWFVGAVLHGSRGVRMYWPRFFVEITVFDSWQVATWLGATLWFAGIGLLALMVISWRRPSMVIAGLAAGAVAVAMTGAATMARVEYRITDPQGDKALDGVAVAGEVCSEAEVTVCLVPSYGAVRDSLVEAFGDIGPRLALTPAHLDRVELRPRGVGQTPPEGVAAFAMDRALTGDVPGAMAEFIEGFSNVDACYSEQGIDSWAYNAVVTEWLIGSPVTVEPIAAGDTTGAQAWFSSLPEQAKREWLGRNWSAYTTCELSAADFAHGDGP